MFVYNMLRCDANLIVGLVFGQPLEGKLHGYISINIVFNRSDDPVVGDSTLDIVKFLPRSLAISTVYNEVEPLLVVCGKTLAP